MKSRMLTQIVRWNGGQARTTIPVDSAFHEVALSSGNILWIQHSSGMLSCLTAVDGNVEPVVIPDRAWGEAVSKYFSGD